MADKVTLTVVVNGQPTQVEATLNEPLMAVIPKALEQTGNAGQPPANWVMRDAACNVLDVRETVGSFHFVAGMALFLNLKAGIGG